MIRFKPDVRIGHFDRATLDVLGPASVWSLRAQVTVRVNSVEDSLDVHGPRSLHRFGRAWDLGVDDEQATSRAALADYLRAMLPPGFDVLLEPTHVHVELDGGWRRGVGQVKA